MAENSKIEWTDHTFNPVIGCQKVSPGCDHCYAESLSNRYGWTEWGPHGERKVTSDSNWRKPIQWNAAAAKTGKRAKVFCASLSDWLDNRWPSGVRGRLGSLIKETPMLDWLLLTKRPENYLKLSPWGSFPPPNVWLGITAEDQAHFDRRWGVIGEFGAAVRFVSYEPAIGPLRLDMRGADCPDWIICGGESGHGARHMHPDWARNLRDDCATAGIAFFMKQMTGKKPIPDDLMVREFPHAEFSCG